MAVEQGATIDLTGYGRLERERTTGTLERIGARQVVLSLRDGGMTYEVPFNLSDGKTATAHDEGFQIIAKDLKRLQETAGFTVNSSQEGKSEPSSDAGNSTPATRKRKPIMAAATVEKPASAGKVKKTGAATPPAAAPAATAGKNGKSKTGATPVVTAAKKASAAPAAPAGKAKGTAAPPVQTPPAAAPAVRRGRPAAPKQEDEEEDGHELSPMELADRSTKTVPEGSAEINVSPLMFRQLRWNELRPYPEGRKVPGFTAFKKAMDAANERSYVYLVVNEAAARFLVERAFVNGFNGAWVGGLAGGFKRAAKRLAASLAETFGFTVPPVIANYAGSGRGKAAEEEEEAAPVRRGRKPATPPAAAPAATAGKNGKGKTPAAPATGGARVRLAAPKKK